MGEAQQTIAVAGTTPFAFVLAGLLAADHGRKVYVVAPRPSFGAVPPPHSFSLWPTARPETLQLITTSAPEILRRIARIVPEAVERTDVEIRAPRSHHADALSHFRHLANGFGHVVERLAGTQGDEAIGMRMRDVMQLSPAPFLESVRDWASRIGVEWIEDQSALNPRKNGTAQIGEITIDKVVLADDEALTRHVPTATIGQLGQLIDHTAYIAEAGHKVSDPYLAISDTTMLTPLRDGTLAIHVDDSDGLGDARVASHVPHGVRRAARRRYRSFRPHDGAPIIGTTKGNQIYITAGLGALDVALAPIIARHICGEVHGFEAEWCAMHTPTRAMSRSLVADIMLGMPA